MTRERYHDNKSRVFEIYGVDEQDPKYNCHHICFKRDTKRGRIFEGMDINAKANLIPMLKTEHSELHAKVDKMEGYTTTKKKKKKKKKRRRR